MNNPYDQQAVASVLNVTNRLTAAELAKILHWTRTRTRKALYGLEQQAAVNHNPDRTWEATK